jgi:hypothetical protein
MDAMPDHIPGLTLSERYYWEIVRPILDQSFPRLPHSAALLGPGSEVMGFDTPRSTDHHWGLRLILFLSVEDWPSLSSKVDKALRYGLPFEFLGFSTNFTAPDPADNGVRLPQLVGKGPVNHMIEITTVEDFGRCELGVDPFGDFSPQDWMIFEEQRLLSLTGGRVYYDGLGQLGMLREKLTYYPQDIWLYLLAAEWQKISQEEAFVGRTGEVGDELGSRIVSARLVQSLMRLGFMMERKYIPYSKWFGTGYSRLSCAPRLLPALQGVLSAVTWKEREEYLCQAYTQAAEMHNALRITPPVATQSSLYHNRPFRVIHGDEIAAQIKKAIRDERVLSLMPDIGSVNQFLVSVDVLSDNDLRQKLRVLYD